MTSALEQYRQVVRHYAQDGQLSAVARQILEQQRRALNLLTEEAAAIEQSILQPSSTVESKSPDPVQANRAEESDRLDAPTSDAAPAEDSPPAKQNSPAAAKPDASPLFEAEAANNSVSDPWRLPESPPAEAKSRYQNAFARAIRIQFPLDEIMKLGLQSLQQTLGLSDPTVEAIEIRALEELEAEQQQYRENLQQYREEFDAAKQSLQNESVQDELWALQRRLGLHSEDVLRLERDVLKEARTPVNHDLSGSMLLSLASPQLQALEQELFEAAIADVQNFPSREAMPHLAPEKAVPDKTDAHVADAERLTRSSSSEPATSRDAHLSLHQSPLSDTRIDPQIDTKIETQIDTKIDTTANLQQTAQQTADKGSPAIDAQTATAAPPSELEIAFQELELHLNAGSSRDWWKADQSTHEILLRLSASESPSWLDTDAIKQIHQTDALQRLDRLWRQASSGRFGLLPQRQVYDRVAEQIRQQYQTKMKPERLQSLCVQEFVHELGWWDNRLQFLKFYKWLSFEADLEKAPDIPQGQFPAYWFWAIPRRYALQLGGIGFGQGGWRIDVPRLEAWISRLASCKFDA